MLKLEVELRTKDKEEISEIMKEIGNKIKDGIDMSNDGKYFFHLKEE
ncbi:hypothetical protein [Bacillus sp. M6-12]|nr:hypothetical protein [Bacillus sp. M6-12]